MVKVIKILNIMATISDGVVYIHSCQISAPSDLWLRTLKQTEIIQSILTNSQKPSRILALSCLIGSASAALHLPMCFEHALAINDRH